VAITPGIALAAPPEPRPNIVVIVADDLGWGDLGAYGSPVIRTPTLDRMASEGVRYSQFYAGSPVCGPSRATLLTGRYTIHSSVTTNGSPLPLDEETLAEALVGLGYATGIVGKWHPARSRPMYHGFERAQYLTPGAAQQQFVERMWNGDEPVRVKGYSSDLLTQKAERFVNQHRTQPFLLWLAYTVPHFELQAPEDAIAEYRSAFLAPDTGGLPCATYAAMVTRMDRDIGELLKRIRDLELDSRTLVVFTSDNGASTEAHVADCAARLRSNGPLRGAKRDLWEGGIRVPFIVRWPSRIPAGRRVDAPAHAIDLFPTLLAAAGGEPQKSWQLDGINLLPEWLGAGAGAARDLFWEWRVPGAESVALRSGDDKLLINEGQALLFDLGRDPGESNDLAAAQPARVAELRAKLAAWLASEVKRPPEPRRRRSPSPPPLPDDDEGPKLPDR